jgi:hypothetical protein
MVEQKKRRAPPPGVAIGRDGPYVMGPTMWHLSGMAKFSEPATRIAFANMALLHDPNCIEAFATLAFHADTPIARLAHLVSAVKAGDKTWAPIADRYGQRMDWWGFAGLRPYLDAIMDLGDAHVEVGNIQAATWCYGRLLRMGPKTEEDINRVATRLRSVVAASLPHAGP